MALTITKITGTGGNPPTQLIVEGTVFGCETVYVTSSCTKARPDGNGWAATLTGLSGTPQSPQPWSVVLPNDGCDCGDSVIVSASCVLGMPEGGTTTFPSKTIICDPPPPSCPIITIKPVRVEPNCTNGKRRVEFTIQVSQPMTQTSVFHWDYGDGTSSSPSLGPPLILTGNSAAFPVPADHHDYAPGTYIATLKTDLPSPCPDTPVTVVVPACPSCPTQVQAIQISEGPCDSQRNRTVNATAVPVPGFVVGSYLWGWDSGNALAGGQTSPSQTFAGGSMHSVELAAITGGCTQLLSLSFPVGKCPAPPLCPSLTSLTANPSTGTDPLMVNFQVSVTAAGAIVPDAQGNLYHWVFGDGTTDDTLTPDARHLYASAGTFTATVTVDVPSGCSPTKIPISVKVTPLCPTLTGLAANPASGTAPLMVNFQVSITNPGAIVPDAQGNLYHWVFGDGTTADTPTPNTSHTYASAGSFTAGVKVNVPSGCSATTVTTSITTTGGGGGGGGGFDLCCFLIWWWGISHLVAGTFLYYNLWIGGLISSGVATIVFGIWIGVCCWPCALSFWRCCTLLKWVAMFNTALLILFAIYNARSPGNFWVVVSFGAVGTIVAIAMAASKCGSVPNILDPTTWPSCKCP